jgi:hypothetical protein
MVNENLKIIDIKNEIEPNEFFALYLLKTI